MRRRVLSSRISRRVWLSWSGVSRDRTSRIPVRSDNRNPEALAVLMCPECSSSQVVITGFDFGICPETGYHDAGERFRCLECGAAGPADDLSLVSAESDPTGSRPTAP